MKSQEIGHDIRSIERQLELEPWEREVVGMHRAVDLVDQKARGENKHGFDGEDLLAIHKAVLNDPFNPHLSGVLRRVRVKLRLKVKGEFREANFLPIHPNQLPELFEEFSSELREKTESIDNSTPVSEVIETAAWAHHKVIRIHPFIDGNGRTARLLIDLVFKRAGLPYITDWGARNDQYKDVVDKSFRYDDENIFKELLARKLLVSIKRLEKDGLVQEVAQIKEDVSLYLAKFE